jgi:hypothetical protein
MQDGWWWGGWSSSNTTDKNASILFDAATYNIYQQRERNTVDCVCAIQVKGDYGCVPEEDEGMVLRG